MVNVEIYLDIVCFTSLPKVLEVTIEELLYVTLNSFSFPLSLFYCYNELVNKDWKGDFMQMRQNNSYFDGTLLGLVWNRLIAILIITFTLGICYPWAKVIIMEWETKHTVINGHRLGFNGTAMGLFGNWIKW